MIIIQEIPHQQWTKEMHRYQYVVSFKGTEAMITAKDFDIPNDILSFIDYHAISNDCEVKFFRIQP